MTMSECSVVITLSVLLAIQPVCCTQSTYFVKPTPDTPCPSEPCLTLSEYTQDAGPLFASNTTMVFLPGDHRLDNDIEITNIITFTMVGDSTTLPDITSNIVCTGPAAFMFQNISYLKIHALELGYCGSATLAAMQLNAILQFELSNSAFYNSRNTSLKATGIGLTITNTSFHGSSSTGLMLSQCTAEFLGSNVFSNNWRSGVHSYKSIIRFDGSTTFVNNLAQYCGGGILAVTTSIYSGSQCTNLTRDAKSGKGRVVRCAGEMSFVQNSAGYGGGICAVLGSHLKFGGNITFTDNIAIHYGGGIYIQNSTLSCEGLTTFGSNSADQAGGGIMCSGSYIIFGTNTNFTSNIALSGGGIFTDGSDLSVKEYASFVNNFAYSGGGLQAQHSTVAFENKESSNNSVTFKGIHSFINNSAALGGGIHMIGSSLNCEGLTSFVNNSAVNGGGISGTKGTQITLSEHTQFTGNTAPAGGGIAVDHSSISIRGHTSFENNSAHYGGGLITQYSTVTFEGNLARYGCRVRGVEMNDERNVSIKGCITFSKNMTGFGGGVLSFNSTVDFGNGSSIFIQNSAKYGSGGAQVTNNTALIIGGTSTFINNTAMYTGGAVHVQDSSHMTLYGNTKLVHNTAEYGAGIYLYNGSLTVTGNTYLYSNMAINGGGVHGTIATITINGNMTFEANSAMANGGGLSLSSTSQFILAANETMYFINNHAEQYGGAIFVADGPFVYCSNFRSGNLWGRCFFQLPEWDDDNDTSVRCIITNNTAGLAGGALYGGMVDRCKLEPFIYYPQPAVFNNVFSITEQNLTTSVIASDPYQVCPCSNGQPDCSTYIISITVYPGETFLVPVVAVGQRNGTVPAIVKSSLEDEQSLLDSLQEAQSVNNTCTALHYTIYSQSSKETMTLTAEGPCLEMGEPLIINITLLQCPTAFMLSNSTKGCTCEKRLQKYTNKCNITSRKIDRDGDFWVGVDSGFGGTVLHPHCPFDYCKSHPVSFTLNETDLECSYDRTGLLCGGCQPGLSNVLGSSHCIKCSGAYLSLMIPFALAGIALVAFLLICKMTVTVGSINGLIFYANIIAVNHSVFLPSGQRNALTIFIAWLNLDVGIETCFYDGMDTYARTWLQFAFPLYVWVIVGTIVILSHYYGMVARMFGRNPIAVLATLFLLSYAKLLRTIIAVLSFTYLEYPDGAKVAVWLYDGNIRYLKGKHIPLFLTALLVLLLLFLPYTLLLLFGQWIQAHSEMRIFSWISNYRVKPFLDAYHAPYRNEYRYWPGMLLVLRCILFLIFAFNVLGNPNVNLFVISVCITAFLILTRFTGKVYTNKFLDAIDASYLLNIGVLATGTLYVRSVGGRQDILVYTSLSIAFTTFLGILVLPCEYTNQRFSSVEGNYLAYPATKEAADIYFTP